MELDRYLVARAAALATVAAGVVLGVTNWRSITSPASVGEPGVLESLLLVKPVLIATRIGVMGIAIYVAASIAGLVIEGRWLVKAGISGAEADSAWSDSLVSGSQDDVVEWLTTTELNIAEIWDAIDAMEERVYAEGGE